MINYLDRAALSVAAPLMTKDLNLDPAQLGIVFSSFFFGYALFCFVGGYASDKIGPKNVFTLAMTVWSVFCGLTAAATSMVTPAGHPRDLRHGRRAVQLDRQQAGQQLVPAPPAGQRGRHGQCRPAARRGALAGPVVGFIAVTAGWRVSFVIIAAIGLCLGPLSGC